MWFIIGIVAILGLLFILSNGVSSGNSYSINDLVNDIENGRVVAITQRGDQDVIVEFQGGGSETTHIDTHSSIEETLLAYGVNVEDICRSYRHQLSQSR